MERVQVLSWFEEEGRAFGSVVDTDCVDDAVREAYAAGASVVYVDGEAIARAGGFGAVPLEYPTDAPGIAGVVIMALCVLIPAAFLVFSAM